MSIISVKDLHMTYKVKKKEQGLWGSIKGLFRDDYTEVQALDGVSFSIEKGEFVGLVGQNGAGKTTLIKILSGILKPTSGQVSVMGFNPSDHKNEFKRNISLVMGQHSQLLWDLPARETFFINKEIYNVSTEKFNSRLSHLSELLDVSSKLDVQVRKLSLGERMKMELIAALLHFPKVVYLDEPTIGLDVISQRKIRDFLRHINKNEGTTIILTSHYTADISEMCKRVIILNNGTILYDDDVTEILEKYNKTKTITFTLVEPVSKKLAASFGELTKYSENEISYKISENEIQAICEKVLEKSQISDMAIKETTMEDVICDVFQ